MHQLLWKKKAGIYRINVFGRVAHTFIMLFGRFGLFILAVDVCY